jgi:hypothetical protein
VQINIRGVKRPSNETFRVLPERERQSIGNESFAQPGVGLGKNPKYIYILHRIQGWAAGKLKE